VIAPRTAGIQDYFNEASLLYFEPGNAEELARQIQFAATHPMDALRVTERGQQVYTAHAWRQEQQALVRVVEKLFEREEERNG